MKKNFIFILTFILTIGLIAGCTQQNANIKMGELEYETLDASELKDNDVQTWYEENYKKEGISSLDIDQYKYVLVSAGEKPTGGYSVEITSIEGKEEKIVVDAKLNVPSKGEMVTEALSYPNVIVKIDKDNRNVVIGEFDITEEDNYDELSNGKGIYVGLIDNNSCEIEVEGKAAAYRLEEEARQSVEEIESGDEVTFTFYENEHGQLVITKIEKVK